MLFYTLSLRGFSAAVIAILLCVAPSVLAQQRIAGAGAMPNMASMSPGVDVLTRSYDITRTGCNEHETVLTPQNISGLRKLFSLDVTGDPAHPDDPRLEAQPLIVTGLKMSDGQRHDVAYVCTMDNNIWAFDANTGTKIWPAPVSLGPSVHPKITPALGFPTRSEIDLWGINIHWGVLSTPVIDRDSQTLYVVDWTSPDNTKANAFFQLHALNLTDGKDKVTPVKIEASASVGGTVIANFIPNSQKQRSALLLLPLPNAHIQARGLQPVLSGNMGMPDSGSQPATNLSKKVLVMACGMIGENTEGEHGWLIAFDPMTLKRMAAFCTTPTTGGGGIWQAGQGPAADTAGNVYVMTSNGGFNGRTDFSESFLMLNYQPPSPTDPTATEGRWVLTTSFTPFRDADRLASEPGTGYDFRDQDLGSAGPIVPTGRALVMGAGKDGVLYILGKGDFGNTTDDEITASKQFSRLKMPPIFFTYFHGFGVDATQTKVLDSNFGHVTHHLHHSPAYWESPDLGPLLFCWGENGNLRAWAVDPAGTVRFLASGSEVSSQGADATGGNLGGMPGGMLAISANGTTKNTGIVWATVPIHGNGNKDVVDGILRAYDASQFTPATNENANATIQLLWDSTRIPNNQFHYNKFCPPVVANGKVFCTTYDGRVDVYGL